MNQKIVENLVFPLLLCITLGLAPFYPEPHIVGKMRWILGGGNGMQIMDYFDLVMHGFPFVLLVRGIVVTVLDMQKERNLE